MMKIFFICFFEKKNNGIKYLVFTPTEKNKEALKKYKRLWEEFALSLNLYVNMSRLNSSHTTQQSFIRNLK